MEKCDDELQTTQKRGFTDGYDEGECFPRARLCGRHHIQSLQGEDERLSLNLGGHGELGFPETLQSFLAQRENGKALHLLRIHAIKLKITTIIYYYYCRRPLKSLQKYEQTELDSSGLCHQAVDLVFLI